MFVYCSNGAFMRAVDPGYQPAAGEVVFPDYATPEQLAAAFPGYAAAQTSQQFAALGAAVDAHCDAVAQARGYTSMVSVASYAASANAVWAADARTAIAWRDAVWSDVISAQAAVTAGTQPMPTAAALIASLPAITWPS